MTGLKFRIPHSELPFGMIQQWARIVAHRRVARDHYLLVLQCPLIARRAKPGQFVHLLCTTGRDRGQSPSGTAPLLRRPFSLFDTDPVRGTCALIYKVVGFGTEVLRETCVGESLDVLGPLGTPFTVEPGVRHAVLIGGGVGIPPLYFLAKERVHRHSYMVHGTWHMEPGQVAVFLGARTRDWVICADDFRRLGVAVHVATDDGTSGYRGSVVDLVRKVLRSTNPGPRSTTFYVCGPTPMMAAAAALARRWGIPAKVSLEERMGCAMGVCMGCVVEIAGPHATAHKRFQRVCTEGPVFPAERVVWRLNGH